MQELRHNFSTGIMNKDQDERLVKQGQYRDAHNIEVSTSEGSNSGVVQNLLGNTKIAEANMASFINYDGGVAPTSYYDLQGGLATNSAVCVATIAAPNTDKIYYFVHSSHTVTPTAQTPLAVQKDYILEYDTISNSIKYVFVDINKVNTKVNGTPINPQQFYIDLGAGTSYNTTGIRVGMSLVSGTNVLPIDGVKVTNIDYDDNKWRVTVDKSVTLADDDDISFVANKVLNFTQNQIITGVNILDDFIFWTDNESEPKKINIPRSIAGTGGTEYLHGAGNGGILGTTASPNNATTQIFQGENAYFHTRLVVDTVDVSSSDLKVVTRAGSLSGSTEVVYVDESHVTVIKKSPATALELGMYRSAVERINPTTGAPNITSVTGTAVFALDQVGLTGLLASPEDEIDLVLNSPADFRVGDVLLFVNLDGNTALSTDEAVADDLVDVRAKVVQVPNEGSAPAIIEAGTADNPYKVKIITIKSGVTTQASQWMIKLEGKDPLFSFKFPRFSYRYKYNDGEYSTFAPWSEIAFLPDKFSYQPTRGHNLGMKNQMRGVKLRGYYANDKALPQDVVEIDILYKETNNPTVYTVKTIRPTDEHPLWPNNSDYPNARGEFELTTDMIHAVVPSNQLLRPWDNVPRKALAQEISANRIIYGNYLQNYSVFNYPKIKLGVSSQLTNSTALYADSQEFAPPSVKSMRDYQVGVVFSDKYGRETPVLTNKDSSIRVLKNQSNYKNRLQVSLDPSVEPPSWAEYYSFYVKETSVQYYTLAQDRWYWAADGNIWLSFPSSERNKIGEDEFIILKKAHGTHDVVHDKAKYKILAVENEAPDFIKTRRVSMGKVYDSGLFGNENYTPGTNIGPDGIGWPLPQYNHVIIEGDSFESVFGDELHKPGFRPENLYLRVWQGSINKSKLYLVTAIAHTQDDEEDINMQSGSEPYRITIEGSFGDDVSFTTQDGSFASAVQGISIELVDYRVMNAPEFDGRFFVKIFKDQILENYVATGSSDGYFLVDSWSTRYINNNAYINGGIYTSASTNSTFVPPGSDGEIPEHAIHPSGLGGFEAANEQPTSPTSYNSDLYASTYYTGTNDDPAYYSSWKFKWGGYHPTENDWSGLVGYNGSGTHEQGNEYVWSNEWFDGQTDLMANCTIRSINGYQAATGLSTQAQINGMTEYDDCAESFWKGIHQTNHFFIDAASASSWGAHYPHYPGNRYHLTQLDNSTPDGWFWISTGLTQPQHAEAGPSGPDEGYFHHGTSTAILPGNFYHHNTIQNITNTWDGTPLLGPPVYAPADYTSANGEVPEGWTAEWPSNTSLAFGTPAALFMGAFGDDLGFGGSDWHGLGPAVYGDNDALAQGAGMTGIPSRGIWSYGDYSCIDLSWTCWSDPGEYPSFDLYGSTTDFIPHSLEADAANGDIIASAAWNFMKELTTPGTQFRFDRDPDQQIYTVLAFQAPYVDIGFDNPVYYAQPTNNHDGMWGIRNVMTYHDQGFSVGGWSAVAYMRAQYARWNRRQRWTLLVTPKIGDTPHGYNPIHGTNPDMASSLPIDDNGGINDPNWRRALKHDGTDADIIEIVSPFSEFGAHYSTSPGIWETEPKESVELDIYYQASNLIPLTLDESTREEYIPINSELVRPNYSYQVAAPFGTGSSYFTTVQNKRIKVTSWTGNRVNLEDMVGWDSQAEAQAFSTSETYSVGDSVTFELPNGASISGVVAQPVLPLHNYIELTGDVTTTNTSEKLFSQTHNLGWYNCWCFGNGVESDRIRDDFNAPQVDNGVKASTTLADSKVREERRKYGMIWSGIYNSTSGVNETNQFIQAEPITKDLNPSHGSIQALKARDTRLVMFCEDKVLRADTNKDLLFNADGNSQVVASNSVVGSAVAYEGDYGISTHPESLAVTPKRMYFADVLRGKVLSLSTEGMANPISAVGMKDYFADLMSGDTHGPVAKAIGTYDERKNEYNLSIGCKYDKLTQNQYTEQITVSYSENSSGWTSFKDFKVSVTPTGGLSVVNGLENAVSLNNNYYSFFDGHIWKHHDNATRNNFYGTQNTSDITVLFNEQSESVKSFLTINYEGSQGLVENWDDASAFADNVGFYNNDSTSGSDAGGTLGTTIVSNVSDGEYINIEDTINGWYIENLTTNLQQCGKIMFKNKEGKWFAYPTGESTTLTNLDEQEFSVQGLGLARMTHNDEDYGHPITITVTDSSTSASGTNWD